MVVRDLTAKEMDEAKALAAFLSRFNHIAPFARSCHELARSEVLTRGQFNKLKELASQKPRPIKQERQSLRGRHSKRSITLPALSPPQQ